MIELIIVMLALVVIAGLIVLFAPSKPDTPGTSSMIFKDKDNDELLIHNASDEGMLLTVLAPSRHWKKSDPNVYTDKNGRSVALIKWRNLPGMIPLDRDDVLDFIISEKNRMDSLMTIRKSKLEVYGTILRETTTNEETI